MTLHLLLAATTSTTTSSSSKHTSSNYSFLIILVVLAAFYFLIIRPRTQRTRQARTQAATIDIGDRVMSVGGIKGVVVGMDDTDVHVEVSPGVVLTFIRKAVNVQPGTAATADDDEPAGVFHDEAGAAGYDEDGEVQHPDFDEHGGVVGDEPGTAGHEGLDDRPGTGTEGP